MSPSSTTTGASTTTTIRRPHTPPPSLSNESTRTSESSPHDKPRAGSNGTLTSSSTPPKLSSSMSTASKQKARRDTMALKKELHLVLGDRATEYWHGLKEFVNGRTNRRDFDRVAASCLQKRKINLHNKFIMAILHNVYQGVPPPPPPPPSSNPAPSSNSTFTFPQPKSTLTSANRPPASTSQPPIAESTDGKERLSTIISRKRRAEEALPDWRTKVRRREVMSFAASQRQRIVNLLPNRSVALAANRANQAKKVPQPSYMALNTMTSTPPELSAIPPLCHEERALPTLDTLRSAMAMEAQIQGLSDGLEGEECVKLVALALKNYMMNHLSTVLRMTRPVPKPPGLLDAIEGITPMGTIATGPAALDPAPPGYLSLHDICFTNEMAPHTVTRTRGGQCLAEEATALLDVFEGTIEERIGPTRKSQLRELGIVGWK
ncbi:transcriptional regulator of RNA polII, SAGA, subunit-domain-containing protein [Phlyctochytrium arcticum]|nr:transcriptional regulator of RNA polII, SAGA, subunit-domain-containing protein [Phlyctochytrium arcticum]